MSNRRVQSRYLLVAAAIYSLSSVLLTWPLVLDFSGLLFGDYGDMRGRAWGLWAKTRGLLDPPVSHLLAAPFGFVPPRVVSQPLSEGPLLLATRLWNEIAALNGLAIVSLPLTATATFFFLQRMLRSNWAAFLGGLAFGFCPAAVMQVVGGHGEYAMNLFVPLFLLALFRHRARRTLASAALVACAFAAITLYSLYIGYFAAFLGLFFAAFDYLAASRIERSSVMRGYASSAALAAMFIIPFQLQALRQLLVTSTEANVKAGYIRSFTDLYAFSARFWEYLLPSPDHPVLGRFVGDLVRANLHGSNVFEQTLYLGATPLALVATGIAFLLRRRFDEDLRTLFLFFSAGAVWMFYLSMPPRIGDTVPTISYFAYDVAPMFRVYARAGILAALMVACAAAVMMAQISRRMAPKRFALLASALCATLAFEFWSVPPFLAMPIEKAPAVYEWLASQPAGTVVAEYPMARFDEAAFYTFSFWQRVHRKQLVNGASPDNEPAWDFYLKVRDLEDRRTPGLLKSAGVTYVIVHTTMYAEGPIPAPLKRYYDARAGALTFGDPPPLTPIGLSLHARFGDDLVYRVR